MRCIECPTDSVLIAFSLGDLPEPELDRVQRHQETCRRCELRARELDDRTDVVLETIRKAVSPPEEAGDFEAMGAGEGPETPAAGHSGAGPAAGPREAAWDGREPPILPDYEVGDAPLGQGSMGIVYKARHRRLNRAVALKMIAGTSGKVSALFEIEARAAARLLHPNIVQIFDIGTYEGQPFLALEFVEGGSLAERLAEGLQPPRLAVELVRVLALAAHYAHQQGIVHCDLKPSNILITPDGVPKIADFGVAKWLGSDDPWGREGDVIGTPRYMAPEQAGGQVGLVGPATDVYSLGVVLYELLTGRPPHISPTSIETLALVCESEPPPPRQLQPKLPRDLETIVLRCLRKDPAKRYVDAKALAEDLERFERGLPIRARPVGPAQQARAWGRRHPAACWAIAISAFWLAALGLLFRYQQASLGRHRTAIGNAPPRTAAPPGVPLFTVRQNEDGSIALRPIHAAIVGDTIAFEAHYGNLGYWHSENDRAVWAFQVDRPGTFGLDLEYACADQSQGNGYQVLIDDAVLQGKAVGTGSWLTYQTFHLGEIGLRAGAHRLEVRCAGQLRPALFDLRTVVLRPVSGAGLPSPQG